MSTIVVLGSGNLEKLPTSHATSSVSSSSLKTTKNGILLVPQPTDDPDEPRNWSFLKKHAALTVLALDSFLLGEPL
ncbi:hypothetical protein VE03_00216 [Pseudogymnoascus sp. 23342-1-I1]|nr:hypothetical protein VE03_00216 [Pseudogymnoascus sp. 23342-1-I1]